MVGNKLLQASDLNNSKHLDLDLHGDLNQSCDSEIESDMMSEGIRLEDQYKKHELIEKEPFSFVKFSDIIKSDQKNDSIFSLD